MVPRASRISIKRVLWGKAARATRAVSAGMVSRGWEGRDIRLFLTSRYGTESLTRAIGAAPAMDRMPIASSQRESVPSPRLFWYLGELGNSIHCYSEASALSYDFSQAKRRHKAPRGQCMRHL